MTWRKQSVLWLLFFACFPGQVVGQPGDLHWEPLAGPFYREGHWWTVCIDAPMLVGSSQKLVASLDRFQNVVNGDCVQSPRIFAYYLVAGSMPSFSLTLYDRLGEKKLNQKKLLRLQRLEPQDCLVGVYSSRLKNVLLSVSSREHIYFQEITDLPDSCQALEIFNVLICDMESCRENQARALRDWVWAGGDLVLANPKLLTSLENWILIQRPSLPFDHKLTEFRAGLGRVLLGKKHIRSVDFRTLWPEIENLLGKSAKYRRSVYPEFADFFPARTWDKKRRATLLFLSSFCLFLSLALWCSFFSRHPAILVAVLILLSSIFSLAVFQKINACLPVDYQRLTFSRLLSGYNIAKETDYHSFRSLGNCRFRYTFDELPMPISLCERGIFQKDVSLGRNQAGWIVEIPKFTRGELAIWRTEKTRTLLGKVDVLKEDGKIFATNKTSFAIDDCLYLNQWKALVLGRMTVGRTACVTRPLEFSRTIYNLTGPWKTRQVFLSWFTQEHPGSVILGQGPRLPIPRGEFACYRQEHVVWLSCD